jgi:hypothetical protein
VPKLSVGLPVGLIWVGKCLKEQNTLFHLFPPDM